MIALRRRSISDLTRPRRRTEIRLSDCCGVASWKNSTEASRSALANWRSAPTRSRGSGCWSWRSGTMPGASHRFREARGPCRHPARRCRPRSTPDPARHDNRPGRDQMRRLRRRRVAAGPAVGARAQDLSGQLHEVRRPGPHALEGPNTSGIASGDFPHPRTCSVRPPAVGPPDDRHPRTKRIHLSSARCSPKHRDSPAPRKLAHPRMARYQNVKITGMNH